jgi:hypothetical protein
LSRQRHDPTTDVKFDHELGVGLDTASAQSVKRFWRSPWHLALSGDSRSAHSGPARCNSSREAPLAA